MLKNGEVNPLNVHGLREVDVLPPHFQVVPLGDMLSDSKSKMKKWIYENLSGRFFFGAVSVPTTTIAVLQHVVGFEEHGEASYFVLMQDHIK